MKTFYAWHFTADEMRDGSPLPKIGKWEHYEGKLEMCKSGLHWSRDPFDALQHAPGANLRRVEIKGDFLEQEDKGCSHYRRTVYQFDAAELLRYFARVQALSVVHLYPNTDDVVFDYLMTGDESLRDAARSAAESAARYAARSAAQSAAWDAARSAAESAARYAARSAAQSAAWAAARSAAESAAQSAARSAAESAAWAAAGSASRSPAGPAWSAAWAAAESASRKDFSKLIGIGGMYEQRRNA